jgi:hypothetical protein
MRKLQEEISKRDQLLDSFETKMEKTLSGTISQDQDARMRLERLRDQLRQKDAELEQVVSQRSTYV